MCDSIFNLEYAHTVPKLSKAVIAGDLKKLKKLILRGCLPQTPDNRGWTAIHCCAFQNNLKALKLILKLKPESKSYLVNLATWEKFTPLHIALKREKPSYKMVKTLLEAGADPNYCSFAMLTPFHLACTKNGNFRIVKLLLRFGANVNANDDLSLFTPLHFAISLSQDLKVIELLLNLTDLTMKNIHDRTPFLEACSLNFLEAVELFLKKDKSVVNVHYGIPALAYAGFNRNLKMTKLLIQSGADVNVRCKAILGYNKVDSDYIIFDGEKYLPIHSSIRNIHIFKLLLELTKSSELMELEENYYSFPLYVMIYAKEEFFEAILQSDLPNQLKTINIQVLAKFLLCYPNMVYIVAKKLPIIFKYNFDLRPENIMQCFMLKMSANAFCENYKILYLLAQMGISSEFQDKNSVINMLENYILGCSDKKKIDLIHSTCDLLSQPILSLKQYSRIALRQHIKTLVKCDYLAFNMVNKLEVPDTLKKFVLFEHFK